MQSNYEYSSGLFPQQYIVFDEFELSYDTTTTKAWESVKPNPDPFVRPVSNPSKMKRKQLRAKRKKK